MDSISNFIANLKKANEEYIKTIEHHFNIEAVSCLRLIPQLDDIFCYGFLGISKNSVEQVESFCHGIHHAFVDDGDYFINAHVKRTDFSEFMAKHKGEDFYDTWYYRLEGGDPCWNIVIDNDSLTKIFKAQIEAQEYYKANKAKIEDQSINYVDRMLAKREGLELKNQDVYEEYQRLADEPNRIIEQLFKEQFDEPPKPEDFMKNKDERGWYC